MVRVIHEAMKPNINLEVVALTGGCFQNRLLFECVCKTLASGGYRCLSHSRVPANDGGVALGQAAVAAARAIRRGVSTGPERLPDR
jgi:hydrogenase maturation protein HypF